MMDIGSTHSSSALGFGARVAVFGLGFNFGFVVADAERRAPNADITDLGIPDPRVLREKEPRQEGVDTQERFPRNRDDVVAG